MKCHRDRSFRLLTLMAIVLVGVACDKSDTPPDAEARKQAAIRQLNTLPYVTRPVVSEQNKGLRGVVRHLRDRTQPGLNLYGSLGHSRAYLRSADGELLQTWTAEDVFSDRQTFVLPPETLALFDGPFAPGLTVAEPVGNGLLAIESLSGLVKLDRRSQVVFSLNNNAHHDLDVAADGTIRVLSAAPRWIDTGRGEIVIIDDLIEVISAAGEIRERHSIFEILASDPGTRTLISDGLRYARHWFRNFDQWRAAKLSEKPDAAEAFDVMFFLYEKAFVEKTRNLSRSHQLFVLYLTPADILHCNSLQVLPEHPDGLWKAGHVLISVRNLDLVAVLDLEAGKVVWSWGPGIISRQHQPSLLANGHLLIFDNGASTGRSRVIEVDPATREIVWTYGDRAETRFFCGAMGGAQGLANGNVLITDSSAGRAFEVDRNGGIVWDFFNPEQGFNPFVRDAETETIAAIYRLQRIDPSSIGDY